MELKIEYVPISTIKPYKRNAKLHPQEQIEEIKNSIQTLGFNDPIGVWHNEIVEGHGRYLAAKQLKMKEVPIIRLDELTDEERRAYALAHNKLTMNSGFDVELLDTELAEIGTINMTLLGFEEPKQEEIEVQEDNFDAEPPEEPKAKYGDLYQLGNHRLMCGDSTKTNDVECLMGGYKADMVFTDPPYGVSYTDKNEFLNRFVTGNRLTQPIENDDKTPEEMHDFWVSAFKNIYESTKEKMCYYITAPQGGDLLLLLLLQAVRESGFALKHQLIWNKNNHVLGRCDYNYKHEPIIYGWKINGTHTFYGGGHFKVSVWDIPKPLQSKLHPTMKPIELISNAIQDGSAEGDSVIDLFGGSGSTLMACEQTNRKCFMMELDPKYVDVIIERWESFTGKKAVLLNGN